MSSSASDRTINKIAFCGAIFAGVAYVGYSVVKQALGKTFSKAEKRKEGENLKVSTENCFLFCIVNYVIAVF
jgi:hypothetical protein